jgi:hypothetical protein
MVPFRAWQNLALGFPGNEGFLRAVFPKMERLLHWNQGFIANLVLTLNSELLYVCSRFLALALRSQYVRSKDARIFPSRPLLADKP